MVHTAWVHCSASLDFGAGSANRSLFRPQEREPVFKRNRPVLFLLGGKVWCVCPQGGHLPSLTPISFICKPACRLLWELYLPGEPGAEVLTQPACVVLPFWKSTVPWADNVSHASVILNAKPRCQSLQVTHQDYAGRGSISQTPRTGSFSLDFGI